MFIQLAAGFLLAVSSFAQESEPAIYPSPWGSGGPDGWDEAYEKARAFVQQLTLTEKVNLTTGTGWEADRCVGMTGSVPRLGFRGLCLQDGPLGVRYGESTALRP
jgi:beta-glucosidase